ncbi:hypothetical protein RHSIM_Rhsim02G0163100 [Rhododendron simsii]|uniref:Ethylene-responsive nuclear family protein n=1 Tax=Rhododendron simsii TaxID=118357 RepID=A0A834HF64_RHOSS|nr:hypothetical protein RHSIM_Rhsim02G0163100 [Rhododendron simsii]
MPLWKKAAKCNRISKLVSDHIHSPHKRGGSLVVETGFPTSLVDLFVKNRDRLKKPSKKKKKFDQESIPMPNSPSVSPVSENSELGLPSVRVNLASEKVNLGSSNRFGNEIVEIEERGLVVDGGGGGGGEVVAANSVLVAILKTFLVVILAMGTKQFVVGITMSAFLLLFMEYAGKHLGWVLKPCLESQKSLVERVVCLFGIKGAKLVVKEDEGLKAPVSDDRFQEIQLVPSNSNFGGSCVIEGHKANDPFQEIQIEQPSPDLVPSTGEIQSVGYELDLHSGKENWLREEIGEKKEVMEKDGASNSDFLDLKCQKRQKENVKKKEVKEKDEVSTCNVVDLKSHRSRSGKIRSKIKKLVSNKLSGSNKKRMSSKNEASSPTGDNVVAVMNEAKELLEEDEQLRGLEYVYVYDNRSPSFSSRGNRERLDFVTSCSSSELSQVETEDTVTREEDIGRETERNSGYFAIIAIVLVGLVWGRVFALAFTLSWYLLLKSAGTLLQKFIEGCPDAASISS